MASPSVDWKKMKVQELKEELARRGLDTSGLKAALVQRLEEASMGTSAEAGADSNKAAVSSESLALKVAVKESENIDKNAGDINLNGGQVAPATHQGTAATIGAAVTIAPGMSDLERKQKRAERFGTDLKLGEGEKRRMRAERFGAVVPEDRKMPEDRKNNTGGTAAALPGRGLSTEEAAKLKTRAERFGIKTELKPSEDGSSKVADSDDLEKKRQRAERFGMPIATGDDWEAKKKQRAERFQQTKAVVA